ncbi:MAG: LuxR C-terminal-related transcriptional regulator [Chromatiales bacterium]|nr:LuxR C-terminal-related transcriptional regulator [Chromatiales bacterium]
MYTISERNTSHGYAGVELQQAYIVNSDPASNSVTASILSTVQVRSHAYRTPSEFMEALPLAPSACLLVNFVLPEINGLQLMGRLRKQGYYQPCIFMASRVDPGLIVTAMNRGAFGFIKKPFESMELIDMVQRALNVSRAISPYMEIALSYKEDRNSLSNRERQILSLLELGRTAREVGAELNLSFRTVENHRIRIFRKLGIRQQSQLVQRSTSLGLLRAQGLIE